jgi:hypothetical protein
VVATATSATTATDASSGTPFAGRAALWFVAVVAAAWSTLRARLMIRRQRRRRRRAHAHVRRHVNRRRDPQLTPHYKPQQDDAHRFHEAARR